MNDVAFIYQATFGRNDGVWAIYCKAICGISNLDFQVSALSNPDSFNPAGGWKPIVRAATIAAAAELGVVVDEVIFPDFSVGA